MKHNEGFLHLVADSKTRVEHAGALRPAERVLSLSALYLTAPRILIVGEPEWDAIGRLSDKDQRHFRQTAEGVDFAHAHLAGEVLPVGVRLTLRPESPENLWVSSLF